MAKFRELLTKLIDRGQGLLAFTWILVQPTGELVDSIQIVACVGLKETGTHFQGLMEVRCIVALNNTLKSTA